LSLQLRERGERKGEDRRGEREREREREREKGIRARAMQVKMCCI
jgi:hypothetical protein